MLVLERGRPYPPGSFTRSPYRARESFWDPPRGLTGMYHYWSFQRHRRAGLHRARRRLADLRQRVHPQGRALVRPRGPQRRRLRVLAGQPRRPRPALRPRREDDRPAALPGRPRAVRVDAQDDRLQGGGGRARPRALPPEAGGHVRQRGAPAGAGRGDRGGASRTCTAVRARPASCAASATSAATSAPRTRSTTTTSPTPSTTARRSARCATSAASSRATAAATRSATRTLGEGRPEAPPTVTLTCDHLILSAGTLGTTYLLLRNRSAFPASRASSARASAATATC